MMARIHLERIEALEEFADRLGEFPDNASTDLFRVEREVEQLERRLEKKHVRARQRLEEARRELERAQAQVSHQNGHSTRAATADVEAARRAKEEAERALREIEELQDEFRARWSEIRPRIRKARAGLQEAGEAGQARLSALAQRAWTYHGKPLLRAVGKIWEGLASYLPGDAGGASTGAGEVSVRSETVSLVRSVRQQPDAPDREDVLKVGRALMADVDEHGGLSDHVQALIRERGELETRLARLRRQQARTLDYLLDLEGVDDYDDLSDSSKKHFRRRARERGLRDARRRMQELKKEIGRHRRARILAVLQAVSDELGDAHPGFGPPDDFTLETNWRHPDPGARLPAGDSETRQYMRRSIAGLPTSWLEASDRRSLRVVHVAGPEDGRQVDNFLEHYRGDGRDSERRSFCVSVRREPSGRELDLIALQNPGRSTGLHEFAHHLESAHPVLRDLERQHYRERTRGEPLRELGPPYPEGEKARPDEFSRRYMGKQYGRTRDGSDRYELLTVGLESLYFGKGGLDGDPESEAFMLGTMMLT